MYRLLALLALLPTLAAAQTSYVATNATVYTVDESMPVAEAFAVEDGRFVAVGSAEAVLEDYPEWPRVDLEGQTVIPGLIDAHAHLLGLGEALLSADLIGSTSKADIVARLVAFAQD
ncbi:amidohydrolase family protein, partial [Rubrivirga sp.]|uniref:amidohydrolase family protein n=1 Tax=Rubrivirga sp. TaxID=1885344 RepID=UPI003C726E04